jgi:hypothetical protein
MCMEISADQPTHCSVGRIAIKKLLDRMPPVRDALPSNTVAVPLYSYASS